MKAKKINTPTAASAGVRGSKNFRRLKGDEMVWQGDFVADQRLGLQRWEGPGGFRADAFLKPIYRRKEGGSNTRGKSR
jgi:hypothetical protein